MMRALVFGVATLLSVLTALGACFSDRPHATAPNPSLTGDCRLPVGAPPVGGVRAIVAIRELRFVPDTVRVPAGTSITWINCEDDGSGLSHTTTSDTGTWDSGLLGPGAVHDQRFDTPGVYSYHCGPHPFMTATVIVQDAAA